MRRTAVVFVVVAAAAATPGRSPGGDLAAAAREADDFLARLLSSDFKLEGTTTYTNTKDGVVDKSTSVELKHAVLRSGSRYTYRGWRTLTPGKFTETCVGSNDRYRFTLSRRLGKSEWLLTGIQDSTVPPEPKDVFSEGAEDARAGAECLTMPFLLRGSIPLSRIESLPGYTRLPAGAASQPGRAVFEFSYEVKPRRSPQPCRSTVRLELDTTFHSLPCSVTQSAPGATGQETWVWTREWKQVDRDRYSITETEEFTYTPPSKPGRVANRSVANLDVSLAGLPESEFRLSAYGLPEPPGFEARPTPLYVWLLAGAGVCLALAVGSSRVDLQACKLEYSIVSPK